MSRRTALSVFSSTLTVLAVSALLASGPAGCKQNQPASQEPALAPDKIAAMHAADKMINEGEDLKLDGETAKDEDKVKRGEQMMAEGERKKAEAAAMK